MSAEQAIHTGGPPPTDVLFGGRGDDQLHDFVAADFGGDFPDDRDRLFAGVGNDHIAVGDGADEIFAGAGADEIWMEADGAADVVRCGRGADRLLYFGGAHDQRDSVIGCERWACGAEATRGGCFSRTRRPGEPGRLVVVCSCG